MLNLFYHKNRIYATYYCEQIVNNRKLCNKSVDKHDKRCYNTNSRTVCDTLTQMTERKKGMDLNKLKGKIVEKGLNVEKLAEYIGVDRSSMYRKLNNFEKITIGEAKQIKDVLGLSNEEATSIFLGV